MKKRVAILLVLSLLTFTLIPAAAFADETPAEQAASEAAAPQDAPPQDELVTTRHSAVIQGEEIGYTVTVGTMAVQTDGEACEFFFRSYTRDGVKNTAERPITFAFNGAAQDMSQ